MIRAAHSKGVTFFDTAKVYGPYTNEELVGKHSRQYVTRSAIATKFGFDNENGGTLIVNESSLEVVEESLKTPRRTDRIDLDYQHRIDPKVPTRR